MNNDWVLITSISNPGRMWCIRAFKLLKAVEFLGLELMGCECAPIENMMQDFLNNKVGRKAFVYEL